MKLERPVVTVTPNPAVDETYSLHGLNPGQTHRVNPPLSRAGGKGVNVAHVVRQVGYPALAIAPIGGPRAVEFTADLKSRGLPYATIPVAAPTRRSFALVDTLNGETTIFNELGASLIDAEWNELNSVVDNQLATAGCLAGCGSLPAKAPDDFYPSLVFRAAAAGVPSIIDTSGPALVAAARAGADALKPNHHELLEATGEPDVHHGAMRLIDLGAKRVFVSLGKDGITAFSASETGVAITARLTEPLSGNPTGAGDAAVAAIAVALASGIDDTETMLRRAVAWSAAAVLMPVAGQIHSSHSELEAKLVVQQNGPNAK